MVSRVEKHALEIEIFTLSLDSELSSLVVARKKAFSTVSARSSHSPRLYLRSGGAYRAGDDSYRYGDYRPRQKLLNWRTTRHAGS